MIMKMIAYREDLDNFRLYFFDGIFLNQD